ncbi:glutamate synthase [candidate division TA06 bacterium]|nr:glutamate synthase [candidate division TA06 bacterium]
MIHEILASRKKLIQGIPLSIRKAEGEGGCGVVGLASSVPVSGKHILSPCGQMHNRGNGKGGGIAAVGLLPEQMGVSREILEEDYLLQIAYLDPKARNEVEQVALLPSLEIHHSYRIPTLDDYREVQGLELRPPEVWRYFCRVKRDALEGFILKNSFPMGQTSRLGGTPTIKESTRSVGANPSVRPGMDGHRWAEDEFVFQNTFRLNQHFYASLGEKRAFVVSHGRNMIVLKLVGFAEDVIQYYCLEDLKAHVWVGHQRYPTKGRVWHPGGAHPFIGLNEALVHNGDFANYASVTQYLRQRNIAPLFLTDTEVSVLLFDLWSRVYQYPLEYVIEAMAPTTERDFFMLPEEKRKIYKEIQASHIHGSPDGPWFFILARNNVAEKTFELLGITDTSMLRPQVFALEEGEVKIGLIASEKQAIDATLRSLSEEDPRFCPKADRYWNARGGSHTDGGAFIFSVRANSPAEGGVKGGLGSASSSLRCTNKFGEIITTPPGQVHWRRDGVDPIRRGMDNPSVGVQSALGREPLLTGKMPVLLGEGGWEDVKEKMKEWQFDTLLGYCREIVEISKKGDKERSQAIQLLTLLIDRHYDTGSKKRSSVLVIVEEALYEIFSFRHPSFLYHLITWENRQGLYAPEGQEEILVVDVHSFPPEGDSGISRFIVEAYQKGWRKFITFDWRGQRFCGCGLGPGTKGVRIDVYGSSGDYLGSGLDGGEVVVHGNGQDQLGQILKEGKLVVHGDVGQTFLYGAKGGDAYILGNAAGRPLINAVGHPHVVINGTALDYLAESFMAGDPLNGGGFVILNGITSNEKGEIIDLETPYAGGNLFSLASGGAIFLRDPLERMDEGQLNGGEFFSITQKDWEIILPYLQENERIFGISIESDLLRGRSPEEVYRKILPARRTVLQETTPNH